MIPANPGKRLEIEIDGREYLRIPVRTELISTTDDIVEVVKRYTEGLVQEGDLVVVSERLSPSPRAGSLSHQ